jgi:hypothetical protein
MRIPYHMKHASSGKLHIHSILGRVAVLHVNLVFTGNR